MIGYCRIISFLPGRIRDRISRSRRGSTCGGFQADDLASGGYELTLDFLFEYFFCGRFLNSFDGFRTYSRTALQTALELRPGAAFGVPLLVEQSYPAYRPVFLKLTPACAMPEGVFSRIGCRGLCGRVLSGLNSQ